MNHLDTSLAPARLTELSATDAATAPVAPAEDARFRAKATEAAVKFESFFIANMLHQMRSGTREMAGEDSVFKNPINTGMLDLADSLVADKMAGQRAFGVADAILRQLLPPAAAENIATKLNGKT